MKIRFLLVVVIGLFLYVPSSGVNERLFPTPDRGMNLSTAGVVLRRAIASKDIAGARQALATLRYLLGVSWEELLRRFADGELDPAMKITKDDLPGSEKKQLFSNITNVAAQDVAGSLAEAAALKAQIQQLERRALQAEGEAARLQRVVLRLETDIQQQVQENEQITQKLAGLRNDLNLRELKIQILEQEKGTEEQQRSEAEGKFATIQKLLSQNNLAKAQLDSELAELRQTMNDLIVQKNGLELSLRLAQRRELVDQAEVAQLTKAKEKLAGELKEQAAAAALLEKNMQELQEQIANEQNTLALLNQANLNLLDSNERLELEKRKLEDLLVQRDTKWRELQKELADKIQELEDSLAEKVTSLEGEAVQRFAQWRAAKRLENMLAIEQRKIKKQEEELAQEKLDKTGKEEQITKLENALEERKKELEKKGKQLEILVNKWVEEKDAREKFELSNKELLKKLQELERLHEDLKRDKARTEELLKKQLDEQGKSLNERLQERGKLLKQVKDLEAVLTDRTKKLQERIKELAGDGTWLKKAYEKLAQEKDDAAIVYEEELKKRASELETLQREFVGAEKEISGLKEKSEKLELENEVLKEELAQAKKQVEELTQKLQRMQNDQLQQQQQFDTWKSEQQNKEKGLRDTIAQMQKESQLAASQLRDKENTIKQIKANLANEREALKKRQVELKKLELQLQRNAEKTDKEIEEQAKTIKKLQQSLMAKQNAIDLLEEGINVGAENIKALEETKLSLEEQVTKLAEDNKEFKEKLAELEEQKSNVQKELGELESAIPQIAAANKAEIENYLEGLRKQYEAVQTLRREVGEKGGQLEAQNKKITGLETKLTEQQKEQIEKDRVAEEKLKNLSEELLEIQQNLDAAKAKALEQQGALAAKDKEIEILSKLQENLDVVRANTVIRVADEAIAAKIENLTKEFQSLLDFVQTILTEEQKMKVSGTGEKTVALSLKERLGNFDTKLTGLQAESGAFIAKDTWKDIADPQSAALMQAFWDWRNNAKVFSSFVWGVGLLS